MYEILHYWGSQLRQHHDLDELAITEWLLLFGQGGWWKIRALDLFHKLNKRKSGGETSSSIRNESAWLMNSIKAIRREHPDYTKHNDN